jgi:hypothetical protein
MTIKITEIRTGRIAIFTPYNPDFVAAMKKKIGGCRWDAEARCWTAPASAAEGVREILRSIYGADDKQASSEPTCRVRVSFAETLCADRAPFTMFGKVIASASGRDSGARVGEGVVFTQGTPKSGGSMKNWETQIPCGCIVEIADVPISLWSRYQASADPENDGYTAERSDAPTVDREALQAEKARLLARLAEIEKILEAK